MPDQNPAPDNTHDSPREVKLSCRNVWKVYGTDPAQFFDTGDGVVGEPAALHGRGLAMLVIAALVGTKGPGQSVYFGFGKADTGPGLVAGFGVALIAMIADRIIQARSARRKAAPGIA